MAIQQGAGYRDPAKTMTIKALQERQKAAQLATAKAVEMPQQISDPWQAASHVLGVGASRFADLSAGRQEADARAHLAQVMSGIDPEKGASMQQIAEMQQLDPEFANKEYERMMAERAAIRDREDTQQFQTGERVGGQQFTAGESEKARAATADQNELNRQADVARQKLADANAAGRQDDAQAATVELEHLQAQIAETKAKTDQETKVASIGQEADARKIEAEKLDLKEGTPEYEAYVLRNAAAPTDPLGGRAAMKDVNELHMQASHIDSALNNINQAKSLAPNIIEGAGNLALIKGALSLPVGSEAALNALMSSKGWTREQVDATTQFDRIMGGETVKFMSSTLKGQSSNYEMAKFTSIMNDPNATSEQRMDALVGMENAIKSDRSVISNSLALNYGDNPLPDYAYNPASTNAPAAADAPADAAAPAVAAPEGETPEAKEQRLRAKYGKK